MESSPAKGWTIKPIVKVFVKDAPMIIDAFKLPWKSYRSLYNYGDFVKYYPYKHTHTNTLTHTRTSLHCNNDRMASIQLNPLSYYLYTFLVLVAVVNIVLAVFVVFVVWG